MTYGSTLWTVKQQSYGHIMKYGQRWIYEIISGYMKHGSNNMHSNVSVESVGHGKASSERYIRIGKEKLDQQKIYH